MESGIDPERVGVRVLEAVQNGERYIFTHPDLRAPTQARFAAIIAGFDAADASPALKGTDHKTPDISGPVP
ncbi:MAG TPA: hypothetical protein VF474_17180 [Phenylobacterium sp.]